MWRRLLTPRWLALHALALSVVAALTWLGWWQWQRGAELDRLQNYSYGIEWWLFAAFAVFVWVKTVADGLEERADDGEQPPAVLPPPTAQQAADEDDDPELAAYNAHLRALHDQAQAER